MLKKIDQWKEKINMESVKIIYCNEKGGIGSLVVPMILIGLLVYVVYTNRDAVGTFFTNMWTFIQTQVENVFS